MRTPNLLGWLCSFIIALLICLSSLYDKVSVFASLSLLLCFVDTPVRCVCGDGDDGGGRGRGTYKIVSGERRTTVSSTAGWQR